MKKVLCGSEMDRMPDWAFRIMACMFRIADIINPPGRRLDPFLIKKGQTVVDYGSGTGRYLRQASQLVGAEGHVYAVDIQILAIESASRMITKFHLDNVKPVLTDGRTVNIPSFTADVVYALDMFHMVKDTNQFLKELCRITKASGILCLEDGHQPRAKTREKVIQSGCWEIADEKKGYLVCRPHVHQTSV